MLFNIQAHLQWYNKCDISENFCCCSQFVQWCFLDSTDYTVLNARVISEWWDAKDAEGSSQTYIKVLS